MGLWTNLFSTRGSVQTKSAGDITTSADLAKLITSSSKADMPIYAAYQNALTVYAHNPVGHRCVDLLATNAAAVDIDVYVKDEEAADTHPLVKLLKRPNPQMSGARFIQEIVSFYLLAGDVFITRSSNSGAGNKISYDLLKRGKGELYVLNPAEITIVQGNGIFPQEYIYEPWNGAPGRTFPVDQVTGQCELLHIRSFNPNYKFRGMPAAASAWPGILNHNAAAEWNYNQLANNAVPTLVLKALEGSSLTPEQSRELADEFQRVYGGTKNTGKTIVLSDFDAVPVGFDPTRMQYIDGKNMAARDIALAFGVPAQLLGIPGDSTYSNMEQAVLSLHQQRIFPLLDAICNELTLWLSPIFGDDVRIDFDVDSVPAVEESRQAKFLMVKDASFLTINEKREMLGFDPLPDPKYDKLQDPPAIDPTSGKANNKPEQDGSANNNASQSSTNAPDGTGEDGSTA